MSALEREVRLERNGAPALAVTLCLPSAPRASVAIVHGLGEHGGRYLDLARWLAARGVASARVDLRGFGRSGGPRAASRGFAELVDDALAACSLLAGEVGACGPRTLLGHSLGGLVALTLALERPAALDRLVLSSPALRLAMRIPAPKRALAALAARLAPRLALPAGIDPYLLTHDLARLCAFQADPLRVRIARAGPFRDLRSAQRDVLARAEVLSVPTLVLIGEQDAIADPAGAREFASRARRARLVRFPQAGHEPLFETCGLRAAQELLAAAVGPPW